jgi:hypothetical protein
MELKSQSRHTHFDDEGVAVAPVVLEKTKDFLVSIL